MLDLHTHTIHSDGELLPAELARRVDALGYRYIALTDHVGPSNLEPVARAILLAAEELNPHLEVTIIPGVELTRHAFVKAGHGVSPSVRDIVDSIDNAREELFPPEGKEQFVRLFGPGAKLFGVGRCSREREDIRIERIFHTF